MSLCAEDLGDILHAVLARAESLGLGIGLGAILAGAGRCCREEVVMRGTAALPA